MRAPLLDQQTVIDRCCTDHYGLLVHTALLHPYADGTTELDISDQLPYSDWSPGRWALRIEQAQGASNGD